MSAARRSASRPRKESGARAPKAGAPGPRPPRDTPLDPLPVAPRAGPLIEPPVLAPLPSAAAALAMRPETIEAAYEAWDALREERAVARSALGAERARLEEQGALLLGAVKAAAAPPNAPGSAALVKTSELERLAEDAHRSWEVSRAALEGRACEAEAGFAAALAEVTAEVVRRVRAQAALAPPRAGLMVRILPNERRILHLRRPSPDEAVLLLQAMSGRAPTRYGFLFDDSTDDALLAPPTLYPDEGVTRPRPRPAELMAELGPRATFWPVKGMLFLALPGLTMRWLSRGAVLEAEVADGEGFRNLLTRDEAEQITGALLSLKLAGALELELVRG
ncbi:MAG: hypothetical protein INH41_15245 [Myxococcaceae bacterium]|nr:hypothetical protein [Myxococcaceae bacterium]MCA3013734.1 hypothetical protein [Myxococcaceae bacterium]